MKRNIFHVLKLSKGNDSTSLSDDDHLIMNMSFPRHGNHKNSTFGLETKLSPRNQDSIETDWSYFSAACYRQKQSQGHRQ